MLLLRLYPATWRARYGEEFAALLEARPPRFRDRLDILRGAADARIHPQLGRAAPSEASLPHDRSAAALLLVGGLFLTGWAAFAVNLMPRWDSADAIPSPELLNLALAAGWLGSIAVAVAMVIIALRYDAWIGRAGAVGAALLGSGLVFASAGGGVGALLMIAIGTALFATRARRRVIGTTSALALTAATSLLIAAFMLFAAGGGQDVRLLLGLLAYGPAWIVVALDLRVPAPLQIGPQPVPVSAAILGTGA